jgi:hypothetical protein
MICKSVNGKSQVIIGLMIEIAVLIGLLWKHTDLYDFECSFLLFLVLPFLMVYHWFLLEKNIKKIDFVWQYD